MATYNRSNVLPYSIGSVLGQTCANFELLVIGDGCTDDSRSVVEAVGDARLRWIGLQQNSGHQSVPNNVGLAEARGEYIAYLGHDDLWLPHHLQLCSDALQQGSDLVYGLSLIVSEDNRGNFLGPAILPYQAGEWIPPSAVVHRKSVIDSVGNWKHYSEVESNRGPESELWQRIQIAGFRMTLLPRLSVIKIPAALRKDVYKTRSTGEQAYWQARIENDPGLEASELATCYINLRSLDPGQIGTTRYKTVLRYFLHETLLRIRRRLRGLLRKRLPIIEQNRRYKGLTPRP